MNINFEKLDRISDITIKNQTGGMKWVRPQPSEDIVPQRRTHLLDKTKMDMDALLVSVTRKGFFPVDVLLSQRVPLMQARNRIVDNPFKYYNPRYRIELSELNKKLDTLDKQISDLERTEFDTNELDLRAVIENASKSLKECFSLLKKK